MLGFRPIEQRLIIGGERAGLGADGWDSWLHIRRARQRSSLRAGLWRRWRCSQPFDHVGACLRASSATRGDGPRFSGLGRVGRVSERWGRSPEGDSPQSWTESASQSSSWYEHRRHRCRWARGRHVCRRCAAAMSHCSRCPAVGPFRRGLAYRSVKTCAGAALEIWPLHEWGPPLCHDSEDELAPWRDDVESPQSEGRRAFRWRLHRIAWAEDAWPFGKKVVKQNARARDL